MSYEFYKIVHLISLACLLLGCGLLIGAFVVTSDYKGPIRKMGFAMHGIGITLMLVSGFGLLARLGLVAGMPSWVYGKLVIWLLLGGITVLIKRKPQWRFPIVGTILVLVGIGASLAITKP